jgi:hypothetical protein
MKTKNQFGENYEYVDDFIESAEQQGKPLLTQMLIDMKEAMIKKDQEIDKLKGQFLKDRRFIKKQLKWIEKQNIKIKILRNKLREHGVK